MSTDLIGCPICKGRKEIIGLWAISEKCWKCKGIGWLEAPSQEVPSKSADSDFMNASSAETIAAFRTDFENAVANKKKAGRPKKMDILE